MIKTLIDAFKELGGKAQFISVVYTAKNTGEKARYTIRLNSNYVNYLRGLVTECEIQLQDRTYGVEERMAWSELKKSFKKSIEYQSKGEENPDYAKKGIYVPLAGGLQLNKNDLTLEIKGVVHSKVVLEPGVYKEVKHRSLRTKLKKLYQNKVLPKYRTLAVDAGHIHTVKLDGDTIEME